MTKKSEPQKCGPRCSNQGGKHWCPPTAIGDCKVFKWTYLRHFGMPKPAALLGLDREQKKARAK